MLRKLLVASIALMTSATTALGCTAVNVLATDGSVVAARSMEWAIDMKWAVVNVPAGTKLELAPPADLDLPTNTATTKHAVLGITTQLVDDVVLLEGINASGLTMSANFLPDFTTYQSVTSEDTGYVSIYDFGSWSLGMFDDVAALQEGLGKVKIWWDGQTIGGSPIDVHFVFTDKSGASIVLELVDGEQRIHKNIVHVLTNAPTYDWHLNNLRNYMDLRSMAVTSLNIGTTDVTSLGQGGGLRGVPADYTPPSRFVKAAYLRHFATEPQNATEAVSVAGHIMNTVDIPHGVVRGREGDQIFTDYTQWIVIKDLANNRFMIADYANRLNYLTIDLDAVFAQDESVVVPVKDLPYPTSEPLAQLK